MKSRSKKKKKSPRAKCFGLNVFYNQRIISPELFLPNVAKGSVEGLNFQVRNIPVQNVRAQNFRVRGLNLRRNSSEIFAGNVEKEGENESPVEVSEGINSILEFWFGSWARSDFQGQVSPEAQMSLSKLWFGGGSDLDSRIRQRFFVLIESAKKGQLAEWEETPHGALALVLLLDQFTRNAFRDSGEAFESDDLALAVAKRAIEKGFDRQVLGPMRFFFYLPFEHSEVLENQELSVLYFRTSFSHISSPPLKSFCAQMLDFAERHFSVLRKYGRFPHRNVLLGRESTLEEIEYLKGGKWF